MAFDPDLQRDLAAVWHPCTQMRDHETCPPLLIERGEGVYLMDREGRRYLDAISSWWVNLFGHNHPRLNAAVYRQLVEVAHVMFAGVTHRPAIDLAAALLRQAPANLGKVFFSDNGSTAVEVALKMSVQYWAQTGSPERVEFVHLKGAYHGETLGALSVCGLDLFRQKFDRIMVKNIAAAGPDCYRCPYELRPGDCAGECFVSMEETLTRRAGTIAAVVIEPLVQGAAGMKMYPPVYLRKLENLCRELDILTIYDEVAVGFCRTGAMFVSADLGLRPTFLCLSKGITAGYLPLAATLAENRIYGAFYGGYEEGKMFLHSHSYTANALACACANETLRMLTEPGFADRLRLGIRWLGEYGRSLAGFVACGEFRQTGMIARLELVKDRQTKEPFPLERRTGYAVHREGLKRGILLRPLGNVVYLMPPLIAGEEEIRAMCELTHDSVRAALTE